MSKANYCLKKRIKKNNEMKYRKMALILFLHKKKYIQLPNNNQNWVTKNILVCDFHIFFIDELFIF
jgi:hypothetical protein